MSNDYVTGNYPTQDDTTSEGGYGSANVFSPQNQRHANTQFSNNGLVDQSVDGGSLRSSVQDAKQGADQRTREQFAHEARRDFDALNPDWTDERLASAYADRRGQKYESSGAAGNDSDVGAM
ncbi:hypothetical protein L226DRAFT_539557, partial [Lentinus tigrinus ALCF2SS1-7]|uniref:uncharacterized protein n=1 Tax=Lentinus tigrinus ALCF2SS1-7 TaxID=1328758 RepID=UPI001165CB1D